MNSDQRHKLLNFLNRKLARHDFDQAKIIIDQRPTLKREEEGILDKEIRLQNEYSEIIQKLHKLEALDGEPVGIVIDALKERRRLIGS